MSIYDKLITEYCKVCGNGFGGKMSIYDKLNEQQKEAVFYTEGPLLILAGAGSGKTRVLTYRTAYLINEKHVAPWNILAITFTNKAAREMKERVEDLVGAKGVWISTFHSMCVRILRRHIGLLGYDTNFAIYDADDQKTLMKEVCKKVIPYTKIESERNLLSAISSAKNEMITPKEYEQYASGDFIKKNTARVYFEYDRRLRANNALDFDDLLLKTVQLFQVHPDVLDLWQEHFRYIMVDEYQDTNTVQFELVRLLCAKYRNLCVVGDDDQSIYKFRGANIRNILNFEKEFKDAKVVKLEQNYRSTGNILNAANAVIKNNKGRKAKTLRTDKGAGEKLTVRRFDTGEKEAEFLAEDIKKCVREGASYKDHAILYRTNAQSRLLEESFVSANIPYKIIGGINFYSRREIKDILSYLKTVDNGKDDLAARRIINVPKRGIGSVSINRVQEYADAEGISFYEAAKAAYLIPGIGKAAVKVKDFIKLIEYYKAKAKEAPPSVLLSDILDKTGYIQALKEEDDKETFIARTENIDELISKVSVYEENCAAADVEATLQGFLEEVALVADIDSFDERQDHVALMTLHSAKGLEFPHVYIVGMEDRLFPYYLAKESADPEDMEEERRLCYVGITRAKEKLTLTFARSRMIRGMTMYNKMSDFLKEIPGKFIRQDIFRDKHLYIPASESDAGLANTSYHQVKRAFYSKPFATGNTAKNPAVRGNAALSYKIGDRVRHRKHGEGTVLDIVKGGRDYEVTVDFDTAGVRKMFAKFANLERMGGQ